MRPSVAALMLLVGQPRLTTGAPTLSQEEPLTVLDEGTRLGRATRLNCSGAGVTCTVTAGTATLSVSGGSGGGGSASSCGVRVALDLGASGGLVYSATVSGLSCLTSSMAVACSPFCAADAGVTPETCRAAGLTTQTYARFDAGFSLAVDSPRGATGVYQFDCVAGG